MDLKFTVEQDDRGAEIKLGSHTIHFQYRGHQHELMTDEELEQWAARWFEDRLREKDFTI
jgi:hypothetical protein